MTQPGCQNDLTLANHLFLMFDGKTNNKKIFPLEFLVLGFESHVGNCFFSERILAHVQKIKELFFF